MVSHRTAAAAAILFAIATGDADANQKATGNIAPPTRAERNAGLTIQTEEGVRKLGRKAFHSVCMGGGLFQLVVPMSVSIDFDAARKKELSGTRRIEVIKTVEAQIPKLLRELGEKKTMIAGLPGGAFDLVFLQQIRAFKEGVSAATGVPVIMSRHDRIVMTRGCDTVNTEEAFTAARDNFMHFVRSIQDKLRKKLQGSGRMMEAGLRL